LTLLPFLLLTFFSSNLRLLEEIERGKGVPFMQEGTSLDHCHSLRLPLGVDSTLPWTSSLFSHWTLRFPLLRNFTLLSAMQFLMVPGAFFFLWLKLRE